MPTCAAWLAWRARRGEDTAPQTIREEPGDWPTRSSSSRPDGVQPRRLGQACRRTRVQAERPGRRPCHRRLRACHLLAQGQNPMPCPRLLRLLRPCGRQSGAWSAMAKLRRRPPVRQRARGHLPRPYLEPPRNQGQTAGSPRHIDREIHRGLKRYIARSLFRSHNRFGGLSSTFRTPVTPHPGSSRSRAPIMPGTGRAAHLSRHRNRLRKMVAGANKCFSDAQKSVLQVFTTVLTIFRVSTTV